MKLDFSMSENKQFQIYMFYFEDKKQLSVYFKINGQYYYFLEELKMKGNDVNQFVFNITSKIKVNKSQWMRTIINENRILNSKDFYAISAQLLNQYSTLKYKIWKGISLIRQIPTSISFVNFGRIYAITRQMEKRLFNVIEQIQDIKIKT